MEEEFSCFFSHSTHANDKVKELIPFVVHDNVGDIVLHLVFSCNDVSILSSLVHPNNSVVIETLKNFNLSIKISLSVTAFCQMLILQEFYCHFFLRFNLFADEHFCCHPFAKKLENLVLSVEDGMREGLPSLRQLNVFGFDFHVVIL